MTATDDGGSTAGARPRPTAWRTKVAHQPDGQRVRPPRWYDLPGWPPIAQYAMAVTEGRFVWPWQLSPVVRSAAPVLLVLPCVAADDADIPAWVARR
ncbi:MAG: hypothetical protein OXC07_12245 [Kistimonas sp.]|nr:hypothetical protein [Kistimonas sp.]